MDEVRSAQERAEALDDPAAFLREDQRRESALAALASLLEPKLFAGTHADPQTAVWQVFRTLRPKPSASSICTNRARPRRSICSITSPSWRKSRAPNFRIPSAWVSESPA